MPCVLNPASFGRISRATSAKREPGRSVGFQAELSLSSEEYGTKVNISWPEKNQGEQMLLGASSHHVAGTIYVGRLISQSPLSPLNDPTLKSCVPGI